MKKLRLLLLLVVCMMSLYANSEDFIVGDYKYTIVSFDSKVVSIGAANTSISGDITIPASIVYGGTSYKVGIIAEYGFSGCNNITSVVIPNSVTNISSSAFYCCSSLTAINIPNSVTSIGFMAFYYCSNLTTVSIPNSVTNLGASVFSGCTSLISIALSNNITSISSSLFEGCSNLKTIAIPYGVTIIGERAFRECINLTTVSLPNSLTDIGYQSFRGCTSLTSVTIPSSVLSIGTNAFWNSGLTSVHISDLAAWCQVNFENNPLSYAHHLYMNGEEITDLIIPNNVSVIKKYAFEGCSSITTVTIPNSVNIIEYGVFAECENLTTVKIGNGINRIDGRVFSGSSAIENVYCYAKNVPTTNIDAFYNVYIEYKTLHVPDESLADYKNTDPWKSFATIIGLSGSGDTQKCATPTISYGGKKLTFSCATEGVSYVYEIKDTDIKTGYNNEVTLSATYEISVYATKPGYENSDMATATLVWTNGTFTETTPPASAISQATEFAAKALLIQNNGGTLTIQGTDDGTPVSIYNSGGIQVGSTISKGGVATANTSLQPGSIAIVKIGNKAIKVVMK